MELENKLSRLMTISSKLSWAITKLKMFQIFSKGEHCLIISLICTMKIIMYAFVFSPPSTYQLILKSVRYPGCSKIRQMNYLRLPLTLKASSLWSRGSTSGGNLVKKMLRNFRKLKVMMTRVWEMQMFQTKILNYRISVVKIINI